MELIDKTKQKAEGETIILEFLKEFGGHYKEKLYPEFRNPLKQKFIDLLLKEQNSRCCYCMRNLNANIKIEHLIPQSTKIQTEFDKYINPNTVLNKTNVCLEDDFIKATDPQTPPFPHTVAYQNMTASCSGVDFLSQKKAKHCNSFRGSNYIKPIFLDETLKNKIEYKSDGTLSCIGEEDTLQKLGLNYAVLKMIRRIWLYTNKDCSDLMKFDDSQKNIFLIRLEKEVPNEEYGMLKNFKNETYWNLLKKYDYFASYNKKTTSYER
ncbi:hypothetical protein AGMMS50239_02560 [Bacteroidia bacterium]|nr:hypothetical protein AGMMS50239_02560 [Bacteroidia bacterium]